jgi:hypothetical protein
MGKRFYSLVCEANLGTAPTRTCLHPPRLVLSKTAEWTQKHVLSATFEKIIAAVENSKRVYSANLIFIKAAEQHKFL